MQVPLPKLYAITDVRLSGLSHPEQVAALCAGGATLIQLREKSLSSLEFYHQAKTSLVIARRHGAKLLINDRVDIALAIGADGVHLGQDDLPVTAARALLGNDSIIGISTHTTSQAVNALSEPVDYVAVGPIFSTTTKEKPDPTLGLTGLQEIRQQLGETRLVAIGGITLENGQDVLLAGADCVAVVGALRGDSATIKARTKQFLASLSG